MQVRYLHSALLTALLTATATIAAAADVLTVKECTGFRFNLDEELKLFAGQPRKIEAAGAIAKAPPLEIKRLYQVALLEQSNTRFAVQPGKLTVADGSYAGVLKLNTLEASTMRVTISEAAWIDVIVDGRALESTRHTGGETCKLLRKSVEFSIPPQSAVTLQISGSTEKEIRLAVTPAR